MENSIRDRPRKFTFLLINKFTLLAFSSAVEPLRLANRVVGKPIYEWRTTAEFPDSLECSGGISISVDEGLSKLERGTTIIVVGGENINSTTTKPVLNWLRRESHGASALGAVCTGSYILAKAGLLNERDATIHWENHDSFLEDFPDVNLHDSIFVIDGNRITASGGTAASDLFLRLISDDLGNDIANQVADQMIQTLIRTERDTQRLSIPTRIGVRHPRLSQVIRKMEQNIEEPIPPSVLAESVGMSTRQLERLFSRYLNRSPKRYYMEQRLIRARNLLMQTDMSVINVALACGFTSSSHFSKCFRNHYGTTPYREKGAHESGVK